MSITARFALLMPAALFACGASVSPGGTTVDGGGHEDGSLVDSASDGAGSDGWCIAAVEGSSCKAADLACMPPGDACCIGYVCTCLAV